MACFDTATFSHAVMTEEKIRSVWKILILFLMMFWPVMWTVWFLLGMIIWSAAGVIYSRLWWRTAKTSRANNKQEWKVQVRMRNSSRSPHPSSTFLWFGIETHWAIVIILQHKNSLFLLFKSLLERSSGDLIFLYWYIRHVERTFCRFLESRWTYSIIIYMYRRFYSFSRRFYLKKLTTFYQC